MENQPLKPVESGVNNIISIILGVLVIGLLGFVGYIYQTKNIVPKQKKYTFNQLPQSIQEQYTLKSDILDIEKQLKEATIQISQLKKELNDQKVNKDITISTVTPKELSTKIETKEKVVEKIVKVKDKVNKTNYKTYTCKSFEAGGIVIPSSCKEELFDFLQTNQDAKLFEIIGLVDDTEFRLIKNLEEVYGSAKIKDIKKYVQRGLSRQRVVEMTWLIKEYFHGKGNSDFSLNAVNYTLYSKNKRGFVLKAYY